MGHFQWRSYIDAVVYIINARIILAKKYLRETDDTLLAIARNTGYQNDAHFIRQFKKMTGMTPTEFRGSQWRY